MSKYIAPEFGKDAFNCMHCNVLTKQSWMPMKIPNLGQHGNTPWSVCICDYCTKFSYWYQKRMIIPSGATVPPVHEEFPEECKADYDEARDIVGRSPKAAAAILRLCLQKLMKSLGEKGENINDDIKSIVAKGVPEFVQQTLDYCRVVGNNAVHPGEIQLDDTPDIATSLFESLNLIVEQRLAVPKRIRAQYDMLPEGARRAIEKRDGKT